MNNSIQNLSKLALCWGSYCCDVTRTRAPWGGQDCDVIRTRASVEDRTVMSPGPEPLGRTGCSSAHMSGSQFSTKESQNEQTEALRSLLSGWLPTQPAFLHHLDHWPRVAPPTMAGLPTSILIKKKWPTG